MFVIPTYICHFDLYLSFRPIFVIPTEAEESCNFLVLLKFLAMESSTAVEMTIDQSFPVFDLSQNKKSSVIRRMSNINQAILFAKLFLDMAKYSYIARS